MTNHKTDTNIQVKRTTKHELDKLALAKGESYDQIVQRIVEFYKRNHT